MFPSVFFKLATNDIKWCPTRPNQDQNGSCWPLTLVILQDRQPGQPWFLIRETPYWAILVSWWHFDPHWPHWSPADRFHLKAKMWVLWVLDGLWVTLVVGYNIAILGSRWSVTAPCHIVLHRTTNPTYCTVFTHFNIYLHHVTLLLVQSCEFSSMHKLHLTQPTMPQSTVSHCTPMSHCSVSHSTLVSHCSVSHSSPPTVSHPLSPQSQPPPPDYRPYYSNYFKYPLHCKSLEKAQIFFGGHTKWGFTQSYKKG